MIYLTATLFSRLGDGWLYAIILTYIAARFPNPVSELALSLTLILSLAIVFTLKPLIGRARPSAFSRDPRILEIDHYSFPSGHTMVAFAFAACSACFYPHTLLPLAFFAAITACSRVILDAHYWTDVLVAAIWGSILGYGCAQVVIQWATIKTTMEGSL
jgi:undecaprenyl-diphosphatase